MQTNQTAGRKNRGAPFAIVSALMLIVLMCIAMGVFTISVRQMTRQVFPDTVTATPPYAKYYPTIDVGQTPAWYHTPPPFPTLNLTMPSRLACHFESVCNPMFNGQNMICNYTVRMVCDSVTLAPATPAPPTSTFTPTATLTPSPTATPTATFTPTPTSTPAPLVSPIVMAGASLTVFVVCALLLIGVIVWTIRGRAW